MGFFMLFSWDFPHGNPMNCTMKNLLKWHENLVIIPLKYPQDFNGFGFIVFNGFLSNVSYSFQNLRKALKTFWLQWTTQNTFLISKFVIDTIN